MDTYRLAEEPAIVDGADASSEALYGLVAAVRAGAGAHARRDLDRLATGIAAMPLGDATHWPFGAVMPWGLSRSVWHAWADQMAGDLAGIAAAWYFGNNPAGVAMYDPATGRTFDGINAEGTVNRNSGAESTIHGLLSMLALDARPDVAARALLAGRRAQVTWQRVEAEAGRLAGAATVVTPGSAWTGESQWSGGAYVELRPGGEVVDAATLPARGAYLLLPVIERQQVAAGSVGTRHRLGGADAGSVDHGGAGAQGATATPGYLTVGTAGSATAAGTVDLVSAYAGGGGPARHGRAPTTSRAGWSRRRPARRGRSRRPSSRAASPW